MFPIPIFSLLLTSGGVVPLEPGSIKKIAVNSYTGTDNQQSYSLALLMNDGTLYTQGKNNYGECATGDTTTFYNVWHLAATGVEDVFCVYNVTVIKYTNGDWRFAGAESQFGGGATNAKTAWSVIPTAITGVVDFSQVQYVKGGAGNTLYGYTNGTLYGSGSNGNGCLGSGNSNSVSTPRLISSSVKKAVGHWVCVSYLDNAGVARVSGSQTGIGGSGMASTVMTFTACNIAGTVGETVYVKDWMTTSATTIAIGSATQADTDLYLYTRGIGTSAYSKFAFGPFTSYSIPDGVQNHFFIADNVLYTLGAIQSASGVGTVLANVTDVTPIPVVTGQEWDLSKLTHIAQFAPTSSSPMAHFMVYDGNLFYTGTITPTFNGKPVVGKFTHITEMDIRTPVMTSLELDPIPVSLLGDGVELTWETLPENAGVYNQTFVSSDDAVAHIENGVVAFVGLGNYTISMTAQASDGTTFTSDISGTVHEMTVASDIIPRQLVGDVYPRDYWGINVQPPELVDSGDYSLEYFSQDTAVATVDSDGNITAVGPGTTNITVTLLHGAISASSYSSIEVAELVYSQAGSSRAGQPISSFQS